MRSCLAVTYFCCLGHCFTEKLDLEVAVRGVKLKDDIVSSQVDKGIGL
jgi:hypothetical protein